MISFHCILISPFPVLFAPSYIFFSRMTMFGFSGFEIYMNNTFLKFLSLKKLKL